MLTDFRKTVLRHARYETDAIIILVSIRWYAAYPLSYRHLEEMMQERGVFVDHSSISRWAIRFLPLLEKTFRKRFCRINFFLGLYHTICSNLFQKYTTYCVSYLRNIVNATEPTRLVKVNATEPHQSAQGHDAARGGEFTNSIIAIYLK